MNGIGQGWAFSLSGAGKRTHTPKEKEKTLVPFSPSWGIGG